MNHLPVQRENNPIAHLPENENDFVRLAATINKFIDDETKKPDLTNATTTDFLTLFWYEELLKRNRSGKPLSDHTKKAYKNDAQTLLQFLDKYHIDLKNIGYKEVKSYCYYVNEKYAIKSAIRKLDFFKRLLQYGYKRRFFSEDFSYEVEKPASFKGHYSSKEVEEQRKDKSHTKILNPRELSEEDAKIILRYFEDIVKDSPRNQNFFHFLKTRNRLLGLLLFGTGMRASEIISLNFGNFYEISGSSYVKVLGKGNKERNIPIISKHLIQTLKTHQKNVQTRFNVPEKEMKNLPVLFSPVGITHYNEIKRMSYNNLYKIVKEAVKLAEKNPEISPHWFRHTYVTYLLENNVPLAIVKDNVGHSDISVTNIYLGKIEERKKHKHMSHVNFDEQLDDFE